MTGSSDSDRPVTIYSVADRAGVSIATVSRVLRGSARSSPLTRQKVLRAVEELDYVPLRAARTLDTQRHEAHGLVLPGLHGPYYAELLAGYESTAEQYGQSVVVVISGDRDDLDPRLRTLLSHVDGLALAGGTASDAMIETLARSTPTVILGRPPIEGCDLVSVENLTSAATVTTHLVEHGRRGFVFAGDPATSHDVQERHQGFVAALAEAGLVEALPPIKVWFEETSAPTVVDRVLAAGDQVDALVCANDELALATMMLLARSGIRVPDDLAVVGFDDIMASRYVSPGLTTVQQPTHGLGRWAAIRLHEQIQGRTRPVRPQVLPTKVKLRGSCGCPWDGPGLDDMTLPVSEPAEPV